MEITEAIKIKGARLQIQIQEKTEIGDYHDSLYFGEAELAKLDEKAVIDAVQTRIDNWIAFVKEQSSKPPYEPTKEELIAMKAEAEQRIIETTAQVVDLEAKIAAKDVKPIEPIKVK